MALILGVRSLDCEQGDSLKEATPRPDPSCPKCSLFPKQAMCLPLPAFTYGVSAAWTMPPP